MFCCNKIYNQYFGKLLPLKIRFFNIATLGGVIATCLATITSLCFNMSKNSISSCVASILLFLIAFLLGHFFHKYNLAIYILVFGINFVIYPSLFFTTGGLHSSMPLYFIVGIVLTGLLLNGKIAKLIIAIEIVNYLLIFYFGYKYKNLFLFKCDTYTNINIALNVVIVSIWLCFLFKTLKTYYENEQRRTRELLYKLQEISVKDPLTCTYNRRFLFNYIESGMEKNKQNNYPMSIIMYDIDKFKKFNDDYGHIIGDEVLKEISSILLANCRRYDIVARYGGEEFILVLPGAGENTAYKRAEKIRRLIENTDFNPAIQQPVTISGGIATFDKSMATTEEFIEIADNNLYVAKKNGRNQIIWSNSKINIDKKTNS